jgi:dienelactone hydrolase
MFRHSAARRGALLVAALFLPPALSAAEPEPATGFQPEVEVANPTRLDWQFAAAGFGPRAAELPADYDSRRQRYQLFVPKGYDQARLWPLVVFISPGDDPLGWRFWQRPCEDGDVLFCAAYGAGNNCPPGQRARIVLDMLDDVRRHYRVNPDETYLAGFSGGGRMACTIAFALPEYFGGVVPICGTNPLNDLAYLRHRVRERLSVAFVTGADDFNRAENEAYMAPLFEDLGIRSRLWVVPRVGHAVPPPDVLAAVRDWLAADRKRRQADAAVYPGLRVGPAEVPTAQRQADRLLATAEDELDHADRTWRGAAMLQGIVTRWGKTEAAEKARKMLEEVQADPKRVALLAEQGGEEERRTLAAEGRALERFGDLRRALRAWSLLAEHHPDTPEGRKAAAEAKRLAATPYLGVAFAGSLATVAEVVRKGPADAAGVRAGDVLVTLAGVKIGSAADVRRVLREHKAGEKVALEVQRGGKLVALTVELGALPPADD